MSAADLEDALVSARDYIAEVNANISTRTYQHEEKKNPQAWDNVDARQFNGDTASMLAVLDEAIAAARAARDNNARFDGLIEPSALMLRPNDDGHVQASIAISLKRIADALGGPDAGHALSQNIYHAISNALIEAMQRGQ